MVRSLWTRFLIMSASLVSIGFAIGAIVMPPDPFTQAPILLLVVLLAVTLSYWLVYKREFSF